MVAQHLLDALAAGGTDDRGRGELYGRARRLLSEAADRAQGLGSPMEALRIALSALELEPPARERAGLLYRAARAAFDSGQLNRADALAREAAELHASLGDTLERLRSLLVAVQALYTIGRLQDSLELMREVESNIVALDADDQLILTLNHARCYVTRGLEDRDAQLRTAVDAVVFAEGTTDRRGLALALNHLAIALIDSGSKTTHRALLERVIEISREEGDLTSLSRGLSNIVSEAYVDDLDLALRMGVESYDVGVQGGIAGLAEVALVNLVCARWLRGEWDDLQRDVAVWLDLHESTPTTGALRLVDALVRLARGEAVPHIDVVDSEERWERNYNRLYLAVLTMHRGDADGAARSARDSVLDAYPEGEAQWEDFEIAWTVAVTLQFRAGDLEGVERLVELAAGARVTSTLLLAELARVRGTLARVRGERSPAGAAGSDRRTRGVRRAVPPGARAPRAGRVAGRPGSGRRGSRAARARPGGLRSAGVPDRVTA